MTWIHFESKSALAFPYHLRMLLPKLLGLSNASWKELERESVEKKRLFLAVGPPLLQSLLNEHLRTEPSLAEVVGRRSDKSDFSILLHQITKTEPEILVHTWPSLSAISNVYRDFLRCRSGLRIIHLSPSGAATLLPAATQSVGDPLTLLTQEIEREAAGFAARRKPRRKDHSSEIGLTRWHGLPEDKY